MRVLTDGRPATGATVVGVRARATLADVPWRATSRTTAEGTCELAVDADFAREPIRLSASDSQACTWTDVEAHPGERVTLHLFPSVSIEGRVLGPPESIARAAVWVYCPDWPEVPGKRRVEVAPDGTFSIRGVTRYANMYASSPGWSPSPSLQWDAGAPTQSPIELVLGSRADLREIRVRRSDGAVLPEGATVLARAGTRAWTPFRAGAEGAVRIDTLEPGEAGEAFIEAVRDPHDPARWWSLRTAVRLPPGEAFVSATVEPALGALVRCRTSDGRPVSDLQLTVARMDEDGGLRLRNWVETTGPDGVCAPFARHAESRGTYRIASGQLTLWRGELSPERSDLIDVTLPPATLQTVALRDWDGNPVRTPHFGVQVVDAGAEPEPTFEMALPSEHATTFGAGPEVKLVVPSHRAGGAAVLQTEQRWIGATRRIVRWGDDDPFVVTLPDSTGGVAVRLVDGNGAGVRGVRLVLEGIPAELFGAAFPPTDADGRTALVGVPPARYRYVVLRGTLPLSLEGIVVVERRRLTPVEVVVAR